MVTRTPFLTLTGALLLAAFLLAATVLHCPRCPAQGPSIRFGSKVPAEVDALYERGLEYLVKTQDSSGSWEGYGNVGVTGICLMAFLASGEDPNYGKYAPQVRRSVRFLLAGQDDKTGYYGSSMYEHGFGLLALSEAYGVLDEAALWTGKEKPEDRIPIAKSIELGVALAVGSQKRSRLGGWRYSPDSTDSDTSVTGAVLMGLLAARNAGIEVPDECVDGALEYFQRSTGANGFVAYSGGLSSLGESMNRSAIATLVYAVGKKKDWEEYTNTTEHIVGKLEHNESSYPFYFRYYMAQALFQSDYESWEKWNALLIRKLTSLQADDGSFAGSHGNSYCTGMAMLALALNYRFLPIYER